MDHSAGWIGDTKMILKLFAFKRKLARELAFIQFYNPI